MKQNETDQQVETIEAEQVQETKQVQIINSNFYHYGKVTALTPKGDIVIRRSTIVGIVVEDVIKLGIAICGEADSFSRRLGKLISISRINSNDIIGSIPKQKNSRTTGKQFKAWCDEYCGETVKTVALEKAQYVNEEDAKKAGRLLGKARAAKQKAKNKFLKEFRTAKKEVKKAAREKAKNTNQNETS